MNEPVTYTVVNGFARTTLTLTAHQFTSKGPTASFPLAALRHFCLEPVTVFASVYDAQLVLTRDDGGQVKALRLPVRKSDESFLEFLWALHVRRPDASLLHLDPAAAQRQMGVTSTRRMAWLIVLGLLGVALVAILIGLAASMVQL